METKTKMKEYLDRNPYSEQGIAAMMGIPQCIFSGVKNGNFHRKPDATEAKMESWLERVGYPMEEICQKLRAMSTENYSREIPDGLVLARMRQHSKRAKLIQGASTALAGSATSATGIERIKTGMRKPSKRAASLQS